MIFDHLPTEPDWDGYGSPAPTVEAKASAMIALTVISTRDPSVTPSSDGGVQLEWHTNGIDVELSFNAKGEQDFD